MAPSNSDIKIEYDEEVQSYYIAWRPLAVISAGETDKEALEELRQAAHFGIDTMVDLKLEEVGREGE
jgi:predicted RNase H-like HicB family nuclease